MEANIVLFKCSEKQKYYGVRVQKENGDWYRTWAFEISEKNASKEGYDKEPIRGNLNATEEYPGCPYCGAVGFVQCSKCEKISCWKGETEMVCPWCGGTMKGIAASDEQFDVSGGGY